MQPIKHFTPIEPKHTITEVQYLLDNNCMSYDSLWYQNLNLILGLGDTDLLKNAIHYVTVRRSLILSETTSIRKSSKDTAILDAIIISNNMSDTHYNITGLYNMIKRGNTNFDGLWKSDAPDEVKNDIAHILTIMGEQPKAYQIKDTGCKNKNHHLFSLLTSTLHFNNPPPREYCNEFVIQFALDQRNLSILKPDIAPHIVPHIQRYLDEFGFDVNDWESPILAKNIDQGKPVHTLRQPTTKYLDDRIPTRAAIFNTDSNVFTEDEIIKLEYMINDFDTPCDIQWVFDKYIKHSHELSDILYTELSLLLRNNNYQITIEPKYSSVTTSVINQLFGTQRQFNDWILACPEEKKDTILTCDVSDIEFLGRVSNIPNPPKWLINTDIGSIIFGDNIGKKIKLDNILWVQSLLHTDPEFTSKHNWAVELVDYVIKNLCPFSHSIVEHLNFPGLSEESYAILLYMDQRYDSSYDMVEYEHGITVITEDSSDWFVDFCHFVRMYVTSAVEVGLTFAPNLESTLRCIELAGLSQEYNIRNNLLKEVL